MAIYHLTANIISRARGQSVVAAAAYRSGAALHDERYGITHYHSRKRVILHSEIMAPPGAPAWVCDRQALWNRVEAGESRKDSQLARLIEIGLPVELSVDECVVLVREYVATEFVAKGMIADFCIRGDTHNPNAHILLTLRGVTAQGFGPKERRWNGKATLLEWRSAWADRANEHLARAGQAMRIDHRTLAAQQIELTPGRRIGIAGRPRQGIETLPSHLQERISEQKRIANDNGAAILEDPSVVLRALTHQQPTFSLEDLARFLRSRTDGAEQLDAVLRAVTASSETVALPTGTGAQSRFTSRDMVEAAKSLRNRTLSMAGRRGHGVTAARQNPLQPALSEVQERAFDYLAGEGDVKAIALTDDDRPALLEAARRAWETAGFVVFGAAASRVAALKLAALSGVETRTIASREEAWNEGHEVLGRESVLLVDGAEMMGLKLLERLVAVADKARAKIVLIGNAAQVQAMKIESPFVDVLRRIGHPARLNTDLK